MEKKLVVLMILDGFGLNDCTQANSIKKAKTPTINYLMEKYPFVKGNASGLSVGLPEGQMGNSEVGHLNIGAGRVVYQELTRITKDMEEGNFFKNNSIIKAINNCKKNDSSLHLFGLLSDGGVHSLNRHLYGLLEVAQRENLKKVYIHAFLDGRDTSPTSGKRYLEELEKQISKIGVGEIATVIGRYYAMDRDNRWDRIQKAYNALTKGEGRLMDSPIKAVEESYAQGVTDEFVDPIIISKEGRPVAKVEENDSIIFYNFRPDRARQITRTFCLEDFTAFDRGDRIKTTYLCFTDYDVTIPNKLIAFEKVDLKNTFGKFLADNNKKQLRLAETEKYAHVTFFFNGGEEKPNKGEDRILINSPKVATYDLQPEMSAYQVCDVLVNAIEEKKHDVIIVNFANPDMVGHTGNQESVVKAIEVVDECVKRSLEALLKVDGLMFLCSDHGNAEQMIDYKTGEKLTAHTSNPVPFILINASEDIKLRDGGCLADIAPTLIQLMGLKKPGEMTGISLIV